MARSKAQKGRRSRNRSKFDLVARKNGAVTAVRTCDLRGVNQRQYCRVYREWNSATALEYFKRPSAFQSHFENVIHDRGLGAVRLSERLRQARRVMKAPLVHVRTSTRLDRDVKSARIAYRKMKRKLGWSGEQCDVAFRKHFPKQWRLIANDVER